MCPSYQVTREELHSTRGRAHLLWEMLQGDVVTDGWRSTEVRDALDLCLSCKGCLSDCPVNVDMATYKAEFTHHHYAGRPWARPVSHWSMGWLPLWSRLASRAPRLVNRMARLPLAKRLGGIAPEREIPVFAEQTFTSWFAGRAGPGRLPTGASVVLWPDTFTNHLAPEVGRAAVEVLEAAGFEVVLPAGPVCCGLTWISTGQLQEAKAAHQALSGRLAPYLAAGTPSRRAGAELHRGVPARRGRTAAGRSARRRAGGVDLHIRGVPRPARIGNRHRSLRDALVQTHCHQHAVLGFDADRSLMAAAGINADVPDSGCCGLAGNFGFERGHYDVSKAAGERVLLPAVRGGRADTAIVADGFSCRTQIGHGTAAGARCTWLSCSPTDCVGR